MYIYFKFRTNFFSIRNVNLMMKVKRTAYIWSSVYLWTNIIILSLNMEKLVLHAVLHLHRHLQKFKKEKESLLLLLHILPRLKVHLNLKVIIYQMIIKEVISFV